MKKQALYKDIVKEISKSKTRFLSIMLMIALGSAIFVGLCVTGPTMRNTIFSYTEKHQLQDLTVTSPLGLELEDQVILSSLPSVSRLEYAYRADLMIQDTDHIVAVESLSGLPKYEIVEGNLPSTTNELALDSYMMGKGYKIGDTIHFVREKLHGGYPLKNYFYTISGFVRSPEYMIPSQKGASSVGDGIIDSFGVVAPENFQMDNYSLARLNFQDTKSLDSYSQEYKNRMKAHVDEVEIAFIQRPEIRLDKYHREAMDEISEGEKEIADAEREVLDADKELSDARRDLNDGWLEYEDGKETFQQEIDDAKAEILEAEEELIDAKIQLDVGHLKLTNGQRQLADAKQELREAEDQLEDAKKQLADGEKQLKEAQDEIDQGRVQLAEKSNQLYAGLDQINAGLAQMEAGLNGIQLGIAQIDGRLIQVDTDLQYTEAELPMLSTSIAAIDVALGLIDNRISEIDIQLSEIEAALADGLEPPLSESEKAYLIAEKAGLQGENASLTEEKDLLLAQKVILADQVALIFEKQQLAAQREVLLAQRDALQPQFDELIIQKQVLLDAIPLLEQGRKDLIDGQRRLNQELDNFNEKKKEYEDGVKKLEEGRIEIEDGESDLREAALELANGRAKYNDGVKELEEGRLTLETEKAKGENELKDAYAELLEGEADYREGLREFQDKIPEAQSEIEEGKADLAEAKKDLARLKVPKYTIQGKYDNPGFFQYVENSESMDLLSYIFPVFFFLIALLVCLTTMTRMVDEHRVLIGTIKALGYSNMDIAKKYLVYGSCASLVGSVVGILAGQQIIMPVIFDAYSSNFLFQEELPLFPAIFSIIAVVISLLCTAFAAFMTIKSSLHNNVATLLRPKTPRLGNRILLERIPFIWRRLSFNYKITARNIFRYKRRMLMTIIGVAGCTALVFMGFGIRDSVGDIMTKQYGELFLYDTIVLFDEEADTQEIQGYDKKLMEDNRISNTYTVRFEQGVISVPELLDQDVSLVIPQKEQEFRTINLLRNRKSQDPIPLAEGAVISEKLAYLLKIKEGDLVEFLDSDDVLKTIEISGITENYAGHYMYFSADYYEKIFNKDYKPNGHYITLKNNNPKDISAFSTSMLKDDTVLRTVNTNTSSDVIAELMASMDIIVSVIILVSSLLAIVVLYNLTNINVSERIRELCTIKVLGFYPEEITSYVYRETTLLTAIGIAFGYILGLILHYFIVTAMSPSNVMMGLQVYPRSYVLAAAITLAFSFIVMLIIHQRLKGIDMVESLKAVE